MFSGMGTTIVAAMFRGSEVALAHAGDSRAYLVRDGTVFHLTQDHTLVQEMVSRGELDAEESLKHPQAHVLTRCLGSEPGLRIDMSKFWITTKEDPNQGGGQGGGQDRLALISDGLYSLVSDAELGAIVSDLEPQRACVHLVELAKSRGGFDNITIAIVPLRGNLIDSPSQVAVNSESLKGQLVGATVEEARLNLSRLGILWIVASAAAAFLTMVVYTFTNFA
jgi:protein phosphatase